MGTAVLKNVIASLGNGIIPIILALLAALMPTPVKAGEYLQCVPFARELSGIAIYGDAYSWWDQANGKYQRGTVPVEGAVLSMPGHGSMQLGHVAVVREIIDDRNILISHANWSPINGKRGQIERRVAARDVSANNDWSSIRIWYAPIGKLGTTAFPVNGFIYPAPSPAKVGRHWAAAHQKRGVQATDRRVLDRMLRAELAQSAEEELLGDEEPIDLIGELLDRMGS